ncbi:MAG: MFS transporter [Ruminococcaceae bacterium]|nr:MFS transporter [Oscillospiraceae bacterium]
MDKYLRTRIACYIGYFVQAIINNFLPLLFVTFNTDYNLSYDKIGTLIVINFCVQIAVDLCSIKIIPWLTYRGATLAAHVLAAVGLIALSVLPKIMANTYLAIVISIILYATGSGLIEVIISPLIEYLPGKKSAARMSFLHSFYCWGQVLTVLLTTVLFAVLGRENWSTVAALWAIIPTVNFFIFLKAPIVVPESEQKGGVRDKVFVEPFFYMLFILMLSAGASEISVSQWASTFAEQGLGLQKAVGDLAGPCAFAVLMGAGRLLYGIFGKKININILMLLCAALCLVCYLGIALIPSALGCVIFCAVCGLSVSIMWPGAFSMASARFENGGAPMFGILAAAGDLGCSLGPWLVGLISSGATLKDGFLVASVFPTVIIVVTLCFILKYSCINRQNVLK